MFAATAIVFFIRESNAATTVEQEAALSKSGTCTGGPPCRQFDSYLRDAEATGKSAAMWGNVTMGLGIATAAVAGYYWYRALTHKAAPAGDESSTQTASAGSWITVPVVSENTIGAAAMVSF